jgi:hypothetical protein
MTESTYLFLDTNTLLHFKRPDQIDWLALLKTKAATIVITPLVLRELDSQKVYNPKRKLKERANGVLQWLDTLIDQDGAQIRSKTTIHFVRHEPTINFAAHHLSQDIADDRLIASAIELGQELGVAPKVVTADRGLRLKLPPHGLAPVKLPDSLRLPEEPDEVERQLAQTTKELRALQSRIPSLVLQFTDKPSPYLSALTRPKPPEPPQRMFGVEVSHMEAHSYLSRHQRYSEQYLEWAAQVQRLFTVNLTISNEGTAVGTDILIVLTLPPFLSFIPERMLVEKPDAPSWVGLVSASPQIRRGFKIGPSPVTEATPLYSPDEPFVSFSVPKVVQGRGLKLDPIYLRFKDTEEIRDFDMSYGVSLIESPASVEGTLSFVFEKQA